jgi:hypothetical protein
VLLKELETWSTLPHMGGYLDQPLFLMSCLRVVRRAIRGYENSKQKQAEQQGEIDEILAGLPGGLAFWKQ